MQKFSLKEIYEDITSLDTDVILTSKMLQDKYQLTHFEASCLLYMVNKKEYVPELEELYYPNPSEKQIRCAEIEFLKDVFPYKKSDISGINDSNPLEEEDMKAYVSHGFARWIIPSEAYNLEQIVLYVEITRLANRFKADLREAISHKDKKFLFEKFGNYTQEKIIEYLTQFKCSDEDVKIVLDIVL